MAQIKGTNVAAPVVPFDTSDVHPSHEAKYGRGGYRTAATKAERDGIPAARREAGMLVFVAADGVVYRLAADLTTWSVWTPPPASHQHVAADVADFAAAVVAAAPPTTNASLLTAGTLPDARLSSNIARTTDVSSAVSALVASAPAALDTLNELAAALGNDASFATTVTNSLASKAPIASPTFTGTVGGITKTMVGLGNVDNTSDASKPVSTATQSALDGKAAASHVHAWTDITSGVPSTFAPSAHKTSHATGGSDALSAADIGAAASSHTHAADDITSGTIATARLGSGTADATTFLRGDQTYAAPPVTSVDGATGAVTITKAIIYEFTRSSKPAEATGSNGAYSITLPANSKYIEWYLVGAGGGGGSGRRGAAGSARFGGGGGAAGGVTVGGAPASTFSTLSLSVSVGAGGAGGAAVTADDTNGNAGGHPSTHTFIGLSGSFSPNLSSISAGRAGGAGGGTSTTGTGGDRSQFSAAQWISSNGGSSSATANAALVFGTSRFGGCGAGAGGGISTADVSFSGGSVSGGDIIPAAGNSGGTVAGGTAPGGAGRNADSHGVAARLQAASGSGGAAGDATTPGGAGGNGAFPGGGGGGGGASVNGQDSGAGGNGADGYVRLTVWL